MLRFISRSFTTYSKSSLNFQGNRCVIVHDTDTKVLLDSIKSHFYIYPVSLVLIYGTSKISILGVFGSLLAFLPPVVLTTMYLSDMVTNISLLDDGQTIELGFLLRFPRVQAKISDIRLNSPIETQEQISNKRYQFRLGKKIYHIPGSAHINNVDLFMDVFSGEHIELTDD